MANERYEELKRMLEDRRREIMSEVQEKIRDVRTESGHGKMSEVLDRARVPRRTSRKTSSSR